MLLRQLEKLKRLFFIHRLSDITQIMSSFQVFCFHNDGKPGPKHVAAFALIVKSQNTLLNQVQPSPKTIRPDQEQLLLSVRLIFVGGERN